MFFFKNKKFKYILVFSSKFRVGWELWALSWMIFRCMKSWSSTFLSEGSQSPVFVSLTIRLEPLQASSSDSIPNVIGQSLDCPGRRPLSWCDIPSRHHRAVWLAELQPGHHQGQHHCTTAGLVLWVNKIKYNLNLLLHLNYAQTCSVWASTLFWAEMRWGSISPLKEFYYFSKEKSG